MFVRLIDIEMLVIAVGAGVLLGTVLTRLLMNSRLRRLEQEVWAMSRAEAPQQKVQVNVMVPQPQYVDGPAENSRYVDGMTGLEALEADLARLRYPGTEPARSFPPRTVSPTHLSIDGKQESLESRETVPPRPVEPATADRVGEVPQSFAESTWGMSRHELLDRLEEDARSAS